MIQEQVSLCVGEYFYQWTEFGFIRQWHNKFQCLEAGTQNECY